MIYTLSFIDNIKDFFSDIAKYIAQMTGVVSQFYDLCMSAIDILPGEIKVVLIVCIPIFIIIISIKIVRG